MLHSYQHNACRLFSIQLDQSLHYFRTIIAASFNIIGTNPWWVVYTCSDHYLLWLMHEFSQLYFLDCFVLHMYLPCKCNTFQHCHMVSNPSWVLTLYGILKEISLLWWVTQVATSDWLLSIRWFRWHRQCGPKHMLWSQWSSSGTIHKPIFTFWRHCVINIWVVHPKYLSCH